MRLDVIQRFHLNKQLNQILWKRTNLDIQMQYSNVKTHILMVRVNFMVIYIQVQLQTKVHILFKTCVLIIYKNPNYMDLILKNK